MRDANLLAVSLAELERREWDLDSFLLLKKDLPDSIVMSLVAANRLRLAPCPIVSDSFRARSRARFVTLIQSDAVQRPTASRVSVISRITRRLLGPIVVPLVAALFAVGGASAWTASASARPDSTLYPLKVAAEKLQLFASLTPSEQLDVRIRIAADRLVEADEEARSGHMSAAQSLLHQFDDEYLAARAVLVGNESQIGNGRLVTELDQQLSVLASERSRVAGSDTPLPAVAQVVAPATSTTTGVAAAVSATTSSVSVAAATDTVEPHSVSTDLTAPPTVVAPASTIQIPSGRAELTATLDQSVELVRVLEAEVLAGDAVSSYATAHDYVALVRSIQITSKSAIAILQQEHASLVASEVDAPAVTDGAIQLAADAVADVLATTPSNQLSDVASTSVAPSLAPIIVPTKLQSAPVVASAVQVVATPIALTPVARVQVTSNLPPPITPSAPPPPARVVTGPAVPVMPKGPTVGAKPVAPVPVIGAPVIPIPVIGGPVLQVPASIVSPKPVIVQGGTTGTTIPVVARAPSRFVARPPARVPVTIKTVTRVAAKVR